MQLHSALLLEKLSSSLREGILLQLFTGVWVGIYSSSVASDHMLAPPRSLLVLRKLVETTLEKPQKIKAKQKAPQQKKVHHCFTR